MTLFTDSRVRVWIGIIGLAIVVAGGASAARGARRETAPGPKLAHMVFFTLKDHSKASRNKFVAGCEKYLTGHEGASLLLGRRLRRGRG